MSDVSDRPATSAPAGAGAEMHALMARLFPLCRSITGDGVRATLRGLQDVVPLEIREVPSGTAVLDWTVPAEWNVRQAWFAGPDGRRHADVAAHNLHLVGYSAPFRGRLPLSELRKRLHTMPDRPDWIPYRTSYWRETWGFCLPHREAAALPEGDYEVCVDTTLAPGHLTYGEAVLPGRTADEVLVTTHVCHPSMANDNLSGIAVAAFLARRLAAGPRRFTYRFLFLPGTIGAIVWLALNAERAARVRHGLVLAGLGDAGALTYKRSRGGDAGIDRLAARLVRAAGGSVREFSPYGYDERQFCSPGFDLPVGALSRTPFGTYPEYHTSADDLDFVRPAALADALDFLTGLFGELESARRYVNLCPRGEPQLGRRGLYEALGGTNERENRQMAMLWVLNLSDGHHSTADIAERSGLPLKTVEETAELLRRHDLLAPEAPGGET